MNCGRSARTVPRHRGTDSDREDLRKLAERARAEAAAIRAARRSNSVTISTDT